VEPEAGGGTGWVNMARAYGIYPTIKEQIAPLHVLVAAKRWAPRCRYVS
jgi:hypothetical protein